MTQDFARQIRLTGTHSFKPDFDFAIYVPHVKNEKEILFYDNAQFMDLKTKLNFIDKTRIVEVYLHPKAWKVHKTFS